MKAEKLKVHGCRFCKHYANEIFCELPNESCAFQWIKRFDDQSNPKDKPILWELHPDIAEAMQPETTELKISSFNRGKQYVYVTACCGYTPVTNEKFCPSCGRRIKP